MDSWRILKRFLKDSWRILERDFGDSWGFLKILWKLLIATLGLLMDSWRCFKDSREMNKRPCRILEGFFGICGNRGWTGSRNPMAEIHQLEYGIHLEGIHGILLNEWNRKAGKFDSCSQSERWRCNGGQITRNPSPHQLFMKRRCQIENQLCKNRNKAESGGRKQETKMAIDIPIWIISRRFAILSSVDQALARCSSPPPSQRIPAENLSNNRTHFCWRSDANESIHQEFVAILHRISRESFKNPQESSEEPKESQLNDKNLQESSRILKKPNWTRKNS